MTILKRFLVVLLLTAVIFLYSCGTSDSVPAKDAAEAWYNLGNAYTELGRHTDAVEAYTKAMQLDSGLLSAGYNLARVYLILEKYEECLQQLELLLENDPKNREVRETVAWVNHLQGDDTAALEIYDNILAEFSGSRNSLYNSAVLLSASGDSVEALSRFEQLYELYPEEDTVVFEIAFLEASLDNYESALMWLDKRLSAVADDVEALELAGDVYVQIKSYPDALTAYRKILPSTPLQDISDSKEEQLEFSKETEGRVNFKIGELLLLYIEDVEGGVEAIQRSVDAGWDDQEAFDRLLSNSDAQWFQTVSEILLKEEISTGTDGSVPVEE